MREIDGLALRVGKLLREARAAAPAEFVTWVENDLPFGLDTARRMMGISAAYENLPTKILRNLPRPWQALYALKELPMSVLSDGIAMGEITPQMTVEQAKDWARRKRESGRTSWRAQKRVDLHAGRLMALNASDMTTAVRNALLKWVEIT